MTILAAPTTLPPPILLSDSEALFEIIDGQRVELPPMGTLALALANRLCYKLNVYGEQHACGAAYTEMLFRLPFPGNRLRRPDVAFVSFERWPRERALNNENGWEVVPDLAVELVSPFDLVRELMDKVDEYFRSGVRMVWVVYPDHATVQVYEAMTRVHALGRADVLDGGDVLPGFRLALSDLFALANTDQA